MLISCYRKRRLREACTKKEDQKQRIATQKSGIRASEESNSANNLTLDI